MESQEGDILFYSSFLFNREHFFLFRFFCEIPGPTTWTHLKRVRVRGRPVPGGDGPATQMLADRHGLVDVDVDAAEILATQLVDGVEKAGRRLLGLGHAQHLSKNNPVTIYTETIRL